MSYYKRVLCVCSAGLLRSPTAAFVLSHDPYNFDTRSAGIDCGLVPVSDTLLQWADEIVFMEQRMRELLLKRIYESGLNRPVLKCLNIPDDYGFREPALVDLIGERYPNATMEIT
jgi:predicted protein tyrosine phosphatase